MSRRSSFLSFAVGLGKLSTDCLAAQRKIDLAKARVERERTKAQTDLLKHQQEEARVAEANNKVELQDLKIEQLKLEITLLQRKVGINPDDFAPDLDTKGEL